MSAGRISSKSMVTLQRELHTTQLNVGNNSCSSSRNSLKQTDHHAAMEMPPDGSSRSKLLSPQTLCATAHTYSSWNTYSFTAPQVQHSGEMYFNLLLKLSLVGRASKHAPQAKNFSLGRTFAPQMTFHKS